MLLLEILKLVGGDGGQRSLRACMLWLFLEKAWEGVRHNVCIKKMLLCERELRVGHKQPVYDNDRKRMIRISLVNL